MATRWTQVSFLWKLACHKPFKARHAPTRRVWHILGCGPNGTYIGWEDTPNPTVHLDINPDDHAWEMVCVLAGN